MRLRLIRETTIIALMIFVTMGSLYSQDLEIHVSPNGNNSNSGKSDAPLRSIEMAMSLLHPSIESGLPATLKVVLHNGIHSINKPISFYGADYSDLEIEIVAASGSKPVISGAQVLKRNKSVSGKIWNYGFSDVNEPYDLYVDNKRATRARTPDKGYYRFNDVKEVVLKRGVGRVPESAIQELFLNKEANSSISKLSEEEIKNIRINAFFKWDNTIRHLSSKGSRNNSYYTKGTGMKPWNSMKKGTRFFLENYYSALDSPGEWISVKEGHHSTLIYIPDSLNNNNLVSVKVPILDNLLIVKGEPEQKVKNITFKGISFQYSNYSMPESGFEPAQAASTIGAAIEIDHATDINFIDCEILHTGQHAIWFRQGVIDCSIKECYINDLGGGGIRIGETTIPDDPLKTTGNILVENCIIHSGGYNFPSSVGVWIGQSGDNRIVHNDIADFRYTGVSVGWVWGYDYSPAKNNKILYNRIHHIGWALLSDMAAVYTLGQSEGTEVSNNIVHDIHAHSYGGWGLYTDEGSSYIRMENNLVYNTKTGGFHQHYGKENTIRNNIFAYADMFQVQATRVEDHMSFSFENNIVLGEEGILFSGPWEKIDIKLDNNCYWYNSAGEFDFVGHDFDKWKDVSGHDKNSIIENPGELNIHKGEFLIYKSVAQKITFINDLYKGAGVYGEEEWLAKSRLPQSIIDDFDREVKMNKLQNNGRH